MRGHHLHISAFCHGESWHFRLFWRRRWGFQPCENAGENPPMKGTCWKIVFYVVFTHIFREVASLTSPRNSMDWRAALDILREMQVEEVAPDLPLCQPWNGQCFGPQLIAPFLPYWNKSWKRIAFGVPIFGTHENYIFFVVLWRLRVVPPFGSINKKDKKVSHGLPPICATNHFCRLTTQFGWLYGGFHTWGYPNSWMEENGQSF